MGYLPQRNKARTWAKEGRSFMKKLAIGDFIGSWIASSAIFTDNANPENKVDLIAIGGEIRFTMQEGGKVRNWITMDSYSDEWDALARLTGSKELTLTPAESSRGISVLEVEFKENELVLINRDSRFDFTLSNTTEIPATSVTTFVAN